MSVLSKLEEKIGKRIEGKIRERTYPIVLEIQRLHKDLTLLNKNIEKLIKTIQKGK